MLVPQSLYSTGSSLTAVYSPWFPRGGDYGRFQIQVPQMSSTASTLILGVQMYHKNTGEPGDGVAVGTIAQISGNLLATTHQFHFEVTDGFKELVRYVFGLISVGGSGTSWARFKVLRPTWFNKL